MKRKHRLRRGKEFEWVFANGTSLVNRTLVLYYKPTGQQGKRAGFCVGRRLGKAVVRNRLRRRLKEACRLYWPRVRDGYLVVIVARARARDLEFRELEESLGSLLRRAGLLRDQEES